MKPICDPEALSGKGPQSPKKLIVVHARGKNQACQHIRRVARRK